MQLRRGFKQTVDLEYCLAEEARKLRELATVLPSGPQREAVLHKALQAEAGSRISKWLRSPGSG